MSARFIYSWRHLWTPNSHQGNVKGSLMRLIFNCQSRKIERWGFVFIWQLVRLRWSIREPNLIMPANILIPKIWTSSVGRALKTKLDIIYIYIYIYVSIIWNTIYVVYIAFLVSLFGQYSRWPVDPKTKRQWCEKRLCHNVIMGLPRDVYSCWVFQVALLILACQALSLASAYNGLLQ